MSPKTSFWLLLRLAILLAAFLVQSGEGANFRSFRTKHIDHPTTGATNPNAYCNRLMQQRGMTRHSCKRTNTFINSPANTIIHICRGGGTRVRRNIFRSRSRFRVVVCRNTGGRPPNCQYRGRRGRGRVSVACVRSRPVHYAGLSR